MELAIESSWKNQLQNEFSKPYFESLMQFVKNQYRKHPGAVFPKKDQIFRAFDACPFDDVKIVLLGQDPYPTRGHAHGLCFSVEPDVRPLPKSLKNIYKEMESDLGVTPRDNGNLANWADQGVLLLNAVLTVDEGTPESHANQGWEQFTDAVIDRLNQEKTGIVYILWGSKAQQKAQNVDRNANFVLSSPHPSPLSAYRGFYGSRPFSRANAYLESIGKEAINW